MTRHHLLALGLLLAGCARRDPEPVEFQGVVEFDERTLAFDLAGRVREVRVVRGQRVAAGAVVAVLDDSLDRASRAARVAELDAARAQLALLRAGARAEDVRATAAQLAAARAGARHADAVLQRQQRLASAGAATAVAVDDVQNQLAQLAGQRDALAQRLALLRNGARPEEIASAQARVDAAAAALGALDTRLGHYELRAPADGVIVDAPVEPGEVVAPGAPVATLADLDHPYADVFVPQAEMARVRREGAMQLRVDAYPARFAAHIEHVGESAEFTPRYIFSERERPNLMFRVRVRVDDPQHRLFAGLPAFVRPAVAP